MNKRAETWVENAPTEVLARISRTARPPETEQPSPEYPLGGLVHMQGIGRVELKAIRKELKRREYRRESESSVCYEESDEYQRHLPKPERRPPTDEEMTSGSAWNQYIRDTEEDPDA